MSTLWEVFLIQTDTCWKFELIKSGIIIVQMIKNIYNIKSITETLDIYDLIATNGMQLTSNI